MALPEATTCDFTWFENDGVRADRLLKGNEVCVIGAQQRYAVRWQHPARFLAVFVDEPLVQHLVGDREVGVGVHHFSEIARHDLVFRDISATIRLLCRNCADVHDFYVEAVGTVFATHVMRAHFRAAKQAGPKLTTLAPKQLRRVLDYIDENLKQAMSINDLARLAHLSPCHFIRLFKNTTGVSPHKYLLQRRVLKARDLLQTGEYRVVEVAHEVGFCDQSHLDRYFRRYLGFPPKVLLDRLSAQE